MMVVGRQQKVLENARIPACQVDLHLERCDMRDEVVRVSDDLEMLHVPGRDCALRAKEIPGLSPLYDTPRGLHFRCCRLPSV